MPSNIPTIGPAALAWKIAQHPKIWIPFLLIFAAACFGVYMCIPSMIHQPLPAMSEVREAYISFDPSGEESSFKLLGSRMYLQEFYDCMRRGYASTKPATGYVVATMRLDTIDGKSTYVKFLESDLVVIDGQVYDRTMSPMFLQMLEGFRYSEEYAPEPNPYGRGY